MDKYFQYYVEGKTDFIIVKALIRLGLINAGKVDEFKVLENMFKTVHTRTLKRGIIVVLIFDTDVKIIDKLKENIDFLNKQSNIKEVVCVAQVENLEDELVRSCNIKKVEDLCGAKSTGEFKKILPKISDVGKILKQNEFDINKMWIKQPSEEFAKFDFKREKILK